MGDPKPEIMEPAQDEEITFSFGRNWQSYLESVDDEAVHAALEDINAWLRRSEVQGRRIIDIGSGSGIHSFCFHNLGAAELVSVDVDPASVAATTKMWERAGKPENWRVLHGSALDAEFMSGLGTFDLAYSWGVLHHTGSMWEAIDNAQARVAVGGLFWIALYQKGPKYQEHLELKQRYNRASDREKKAIINREIRKLMLKRLLAGKSPFAWNQRYPRGMDVYHDLIDWHGGLPYEVADVEEVESFLGERGFTLERYVEVPEGGCSIFLLSR